MNTVRYLLVFLTLLMSAPSLAQESHSEARLFVESAVKAALSDMELTESTTKLLLVKDSDGHPLSFIPDCPVCLGVQDAISKFSTGDSDRNLPEGFVSERPSTRTSSMARWVRKAVREKLAELPMEQRLDMAKKLQKASDKGQKELKRYQSRKVQAYKMMWSCLMCDAAARAGDDAK